MDPISIALGVANVAAPWIAKLLTGSDKAAERASEIVSIAKKVTGVDDESKLADALQASPELRLEFERAAMQFAIQTHQEETKQLQTINETMRAEYASSDAYVRRARPTWMYVCAFTWSMQTLAIFIGILWACIYEPDYSPAILGGLSELTGAMTMQWSVALAALGIYVHKRSQEKCLKRGVQPPSIVATVTTALAGRKK